MKVKRNIQLLKEAHKQITSDYLLTTGIFCEGMQYYPFRNHPLTKEQLEEVHHYLTQYLNSWVLPKIEEVINDMEK